MTDEQAMEVCTLKRELDVKRNKALREFLRAWDTLPENVELKQAYETKCAEHGHLFLQKDVPNPFGYTWKECKYCYKRIDIEGPDGEKVEGDLT